MNKQAQLEGVLDKLQGAGGRIQDWYSNLNPDVKNTIIRGLAGAGIGGLAAGGMSALMPHDPEEERPIMGPALLGALLGGTAGAALPYGMKLLTRGTEFAGEPQRDLSTRAADTIVQHGISNPIGWLAGGYAAARSAKPIGAGVRHAWQAAPAWGGQGLGATVSQVGGDLKSLARSTVQRIPGARRLGARGPGHSAPPAAWAKRLGQDLAPTGQFAKGFGKSMMRVAPGAVGRLATIPLAYILGSALNRQLLGTGD